MRKNTHRKDRDKTVLGIISNKRNNFQSIYIGQANFKQDYVGRMFPNFVNRAGPRMSNQGLKTYEFKLLAQRSRLPLLVVNYENGLFSICGHSGNHAIYIALGWRVYWNFILSVIPSNSERSMHILPCEAKNRALVWYKHASFKKSPPKFPPFI